MSKELIKDSVLKPLKLIPDERGWLMEVLRRDDPLFTQFGQAYVTVAYPDVVKAWHCHRVQVDHFTVLSGMGKIVLYDGRENSPTYRQIDEHFLGTQHRAILRIPNGVWHGFKAVGGEPAMILNIPTEPYNHADPDELRAPPHGGPIDYDWTRKDG
ncbi:MAG: dTDP-4-dehydrorhamnose 3,5-epimerase family protein [Phycisphaerales bacterium]|nr:dTDP-4-dehydrorhamnose 3,5-epimerase family protein [Phycisphaerales bacterium]